MHFLEEQNVAYCGDGDIFQIPVGCKAFKFSRFPVCNTCSFSWSPFAVCSPKSSFATKVTNTATAESKRSSRSRYIDASFDWLNSNQSIAGAKSNHRHREVTIDAGVSFRLGIFVRENALGIGEGAGADDQRLSAAFEGLRHGLDRGAVGCRGLDIKSVSRV